MQITRTHFEQIPIDVVKKKVAEEEEREIAEYRRVKEGPQLPAKSRIRNIDRG